jgi:membrane-associated phospholipid phosphatase
VRSVDRSLVRDPLFAVGVGLVGSLVAGPAVVYGVRSFPQQWRRTAEWALIVVALAVAVIADLAWRTLLASALVSLAPLYFVIVALTRGRPTYTPEIALDRAVAVQPEWMVVYGSLYVFAFVLPLLVTRQRELIRRAMQSYLLVMIVAYVGFVLYPTAAPRPAEVIGDGFGAWSLRLIYSLDPPYGCFPSLHVAYSFVSALTCFRVHRGVGAAATGWAALIGISTLYTKQHYVLDVIAGVLSAFAAYALFLRLTPRGAVDEGDRRRAPLRALWAIGLFALAVAGFWVAYRIG